jgi:hypothetical protein
MASCRDFTALITVFLLGCAASTGPDSFRFLHVVPTETVGRLDPDLPLTVALDVAKPSALLEVLPPDSILAQSPESLIVRLAPYPALPPTERSGLESSFVIDFDDDVVKAWIAERDSDTRPSIEQLVTWTRSAIEPAGDRGFDRASVILKTGRGDCTEFAVLLAALARSFGYPARVAVGIVIADSGHSLQAFGHAWTELHSGTGWQLVDATPIGGAIAVGYLPQGELLDEGPGYGLDLARIQAAGITRVRIISP